MALKYWVAKDSNFGTSTGDGTESNPYVGALAVRNALGSGIVSGDTVIFMGEYGPVGLYDAADFPNTSAASLSDDLLLTGASLDMGYGGIQFGNNYTTSSNANGIRFTARGDLPFHVDMRGGSTNAQRMRAALIFSGLNMTIDGWRVAAPDFNYIGDGSDGVTPLTGSSATYAAESSWENGGILVWSAWGSVVRNNTVWGSDAFSRAGIAVFFYSVDSASYDNMSIIIDNNKVWGAYAGIIVETEGSINGDTFRPPQNGRIYVTNNKVWGCRWGSNTTVDINNALDHAGPMSVTGSFKDGRGFALVSGNELSGDGQDLLQIVGVNIIATDNYLHDAAPGREYGSTQRWWDPSGGVWVVTNNTFTTGLGIKMGFAGDGTAGASWLTPGTSGGSFSVDQARNKAIRNRIYNTTAAGISSNGDGGMFIHANEIVNSSGSTVHEAISLGSSPSVAKQHWVSQNYVETNGTALRVTGNNTVYAYNNILDGAGADASIAASGTLTGENNRTVNNDVVNSGTLSWSGTTTGAAEYTVGVGPTVGGNCDGAGSSTGITGNRTTGGKRDITQRRFKVTPSVGPRETP